MDSFTVDGDAVAATRRWRRLAPLIASMAMLSILATQRSYACASCGCTLSADAAMGYSALPGWRLSLEYDYIDQNQLRSGTRAVSGVAPGEELEHETVNQYVTAGLSYSPNSSWYLLLLVPYVVRSHSTYGDYDPSVPLPELSRSFSSSIGDARFVISYQGFLPTHNLGVQLGVKLPTGQYGTAVDFYSGPNAGAPLDASLQPGTGSTDVILGAYYYQAVSQNFDLFVSGQFQAAVKEKMNQPGNDYRPGNATSVVFGLRYEGNPRWVPQVQVNLLHKQPDTGALADVQNTAGTVAYFSPGLTAQLAQSLYAFAFVQLPVYSNLYGIQLFPRWTASAGLSYGF